MAKILPLCLLLYPMTKPILKRKLWRAQASRNRVFISWQLWLPQYPCLLWTWMPDDCPCCIFSASRENLFKHNFFPQSGFLAGFSSFAVHSGLEFNCFRLSVSNAPQPRLFCPSYPTYLNSDSAVLTMSDHQWLVPHGQSATEAYLSVLITVRPLAMPLDHFSYVTNIFYHPSQSQPVSNWGL